MTRALIPVFILLLSVSAALGQIQGTLSNFDARNNTGRPITNLELDLRLVRPGDCP